MSAVLSPDVFRQTTVAEPVPIGRPAMLSLQPSVARLFGAEDIAETGMLAGWSDVEAGHAWHNGIDATLLVATRQRPGPAELEIGLEPYVTRQNPMQEMTLYANGARAGYWQFDRREVVRVNAWIDPGWWREVHERAVLRLVMHMPQAVCPREIGDGEDMRRLAFSFRTITLLPSRMEV